MNDKTYYIGPAANKAEAANWQTACGPSAGKTWPKCLSSPPCWALLCP
jgi:hypothetical protein